jgi:type I site-specific restriction endonuclease
MSSPLSPSEWATRRSRIDPKLNAAGWPVPPIEASSAAIPAHTTALTEYPADNGPADYALCTGGRVVGIVEAIRAGREQSAPANGKPSRTRKPRSGPA